MDDCLKSVQNERLWTHTDSICHCWVQTDKMCQQSCSVLASIPEEDRANDLKTLDIDKNKLLMDRSLGIHRDMKTDVVFLRISP